MPTFIPGRELCGLFYSEIVRPILASGRPHLDYAAALIGAGSEVLGFDTEMSTDHDWAPRTVLFIHEADARLRSDILASLDRELPPDYRGFPVFIYAADGSSQHRVQVTTVRDFFLEYLGFDAKHQIEPADWLSFPEQKLRAIAEAAVYRDDVGLQAVIERFRYYPRDVWLYLLASGWNRIGQEEHLMGRAGMVGDEIGSAIIAARLVRDLMRLCFLMERQYAPYPKWFGTAFTRLECAGKLAPIFRRVLASETWKERESHLVEAYTIVACMHNALGITDPLPTECAPFYDRPFKVIHLHGGFAEAIRAKIEDPAVRRIAEAGLIGGIDQWSDSTDVLSGPRWRERLRVLYAAVDST